MHQYTVKYYTASPGIYISRTMFATSSDCLEEALHESEPWESANIFTIEKVD